MHDSLNYTEFNPVLKIKGFRVGNDSNFLYKDSAKIDLDADGKNDLQFMYIFHFYQPSCNCVGLDCCMSSGFVHCYVKCIGNVEIASVNYMGVQPERLAFGDTIGPKLHWVSYNDYTSLPRWT
ncbi:MAG: hypothetical protein HC905_00435, partial [Bacteroidales bacterium]|nr:hypothetical protein [Bacteroidales bacterium]